MKREFKCDSCGKRIIVEGPVEAMPTGPIKCQDCDPAFRGINAPVPLRESHPIRPSSATITPNPLPSKEIGVCIAYVEGNPGTKKVLKEWLKEGKEVRCFQPGLGPNLDNLTGSVILEGPHYPQPHTWYATGHLVNGRLIKIT